MTKSIYTRSELGPIAEYLMSFQKPLTQEFMAGYSSLEQAAKENGHAVLANRGYGSENSIVSENDNKIFQPAVDKWMSVPFRYERHDGILDKSFTVEKTDPAAEKYPTAYKLVSEFGHHCPIANYSIMAPNTVLKRHTGPENRSGKYVRIHIPLIIPAGDIFMEVDAQEVNWQDMFGFNNQKVHSSFNLSNEYRLIFLIDLDRQFIGLEPGVPFDSNSVSESKPFFRNKNQHHIISGHSGSCGLYIKKIS
jgi:hypothetical protein